MYRCFGRVFTFNLPYKINDSAVTFSQYNTREYIYNNLNFQFYSDEYNLDDIGEFILDPYSTEKKEEVQFIPKPLTIAKGSLDETGWNEFTTDKYN